VGNLAKQYINENPYPYTFYNMAKSMDVLPDYSIAPYANILESLLGGKANFLSFKDPYENL
jgi:hypothetical protein